MTDTPRRYHKRIRLRPSLYTQPGSVCSLTTAVLGRRPVFSDHALAVEAVAVLRHQAVQTGVKVYAYCLMPDHLHLVIEPGPVCAVTAYVGRCKSLITRAAWTHGLQGAIWQKSFWDHFLRAGEELNDAVDYVLANPVRKGLVTAWQEYPFSGSLLLELEGPDRT
ncbi:MAG: REP-associated tyrosine transposase [Chloroflexota bacterium]